MNGFKTLDLTGQLKTPLSIINQIEGINHEI